MVQSASKHALCELEDVRTVLKIADSDTSFDDILRILINGVSSAIESYTGKFFAARDIVSEKYDGKGTVSMLLRRSPVLSIAIIVNDTITLDAADFVFYADTGKVQLIDGTVFVAGPQKVTVSYRCGYEEQDLPADIAMAAQQWVCHLFKIQDKQRWGINSQTVTEESFSFDPGSMPEQTREICDTYRGGL